MAHDMIRPSSQWWARLTYRPKPRPYKPIRDAE